MLSLFNVYLAGAKTRFQNLNRGFSDSQADMVTIIYHATWYKLQHNLNESSEHRIVSMSRGLPSCQPPKQVQFNL